jgi:UDP-N-acetylglucosamine transferase subunit ALG13
VIFVTVGTQLPFDRMIAAVDRWAGAHPGCEVFAQVGPTELVPQHIQFREYITPDECRERMASATAIVAHAGMGTVLSALELGRPLLIVPRRATLGEHRNEHQLATARRFAERGGVAVALDEHDLPARLDELDWLTAAERIGPYASQRLIGALRMFIDAPSVPAPARARGRLAGRRHRENTLA